MCQFIHAADIHLDSPLRGLEQYDGAPVQAIRGASRRALENLVELAINQRVEFVLLCDPSATPDDTAACVKRQPELTP